MMSRLGCQTQGFRRPVGLLGFQPNLPVVSLFYAFHYIVAHEKGRLKTRGQTAFVCHAYDYALF